MPTDAETIAALEKEVFDLQERVRVAEHQLAQSIAMIEDLRNSAAPGPPQKNRWFGYTAPTRRGAFDMMEICAWEGSQLRPPDGPWNYTVRFRFSNMTAVLDQVQFDRFAPIFDAFILRTT